jgi:hypothetical protein
VVLDGDGTPINYGMTDLWHGEAIARAMEVAVPWSSKDLADFGESMLKAYDMWKRDARRGEAVETEVLRMKVCELLRGGVSMLDVSKHLDVGFPAIIRAMTNGVRATCWDWDEVQWLTAEALIYDGFKYHGMDHLAKKLGVHRDVIAKLSEWYDVPLFTEGQARLDYLKDLLIDGLHPLDAAATAREAGYEATNENMYVMRKRLVHQGKVPAPMPERRVAAA